MKLALLFIAILIITSQATEKADGLKTILAQVQESSFGQAISSLVELQQASGRVSEINDLLLSLQALIEDQQTRADTSIENTRAVCAATITDYDTQLTTLKQNLQDSQTELKDLQDEQTVKTQERQDAVDQKEKAMTDYQNAISQVESENASFESHKASFNDAIRACEEAIRLLGDLLRSKAQASFIQMGNQGNMLIQLSKNFQTVKNNLAQNIKKASPNAFIEPIIDVLMELGSSQSLDIEKVNQIISLIQTLLERLRAGLLERTNTHTITIQDLNTLIEHLTTVISTSKTSIDIYDERLQAITTRIEQLSDLISSTESVISTTESVLSATKEDCDLSESTYTTESTQRSAQLKLLQKLIDYFQAEIVNQAALD